MAQSGSLAAGRLLCRGSRPLEARAELQSGQTGRLPVGQIDGERERRQLAHGRHREEEEAGQHSGGRREADSRDGRSRGDHPQ